MNKRTIIAAAKISVVLLACCLLIFSAGCKKKAAAPAPPAPAPAAPPPPPPAKPGITTFTAEPGTIERGQSSTLRWETTNATDVSIDKGVGAVQSQGTRTVFPTETTTYTLTANGPGGSDTRTATVNVTVPPPPPPPSAPPAKRDPGGWLTQEVQDLYFDYDKSDVRGDQQDQARKDADVLKQIFAENPSFTVVVEGHCDERGSAEYNMGLGDRRASAVRDFLVSAGVPADRLRTMSYGKEKQQCTEANEECYQKNRRAHFAPGQ
jgi:peptidoglycan-associated lipoprotein